MSEATVSEVTVRLPAALRPLAGGEDRVRVRAATVGEALAAADGGRGVLMARVLTPDGAQRPLVKMFLGDADIRSLEGLDSPVKDGDVLSIIAAVAGG